ncbi:MAG: DUF305 domain-containing protein [Alphaproteobacteria bacterium]|nr:DUF305 domain-containing protein [Alphaproteobacteria bacterium]
MKMITQLACAALSVALLTAIPVSAQPTDPMASAKCSEAGMKSANESMMKMADATKKAMVMKEMHTAREMMAKKDENGCVTHMEKAMGMMTGMGMMMDVQMMTPNASDSASTKGYKAAMMKTMEGMPTMKFTGDADFDFMNHMRSHHQAAVDMAKVVLANGKDSEVRKLSQDIVAAQEKEIATIDAWLKANGKSASR